MNTKEQKAKELKQRQDYKTRKLKRDSELIDPTEVLARALALFYRIEEKRKLKEQK